MKKLGVGIVGYGRIGREHGGWISRSSAAQVVGVFDPTPARSAMAAVDEHKVFQSIEALLEERTVEAVLIATPTSMHLDGATLALSAGRHVMIEKPMALNLADSERLARLAADRSLVLSVFHCRRWDLDYLTVRRAIRGGVFGKVFNIESRLGQFASCVGPAAAEYRPGWRNERAFGGGGLYDWGSHFVDQLWQAMLPARPTHVFAQLRNNLWSSDSDDLARICINFDNNVVGLCEINTTTARPLPRWHIDGEKGSASSPASPDFDTNVWADLTFTDPAGSTRSIEKADRGLSESDIWERFAAAVRGEGPVAVDVASVLTTMALLDAARVSSAESRTVELKPAVLS